MTEQDANWARGIAFNVCKVNPVWLRHLEDAEQEAVTAFWLMSQKYDPARGVPLRQFVSQRVRGAVVDYLRGARLINRYWENSDQSCCLQAVPLDRDIVAPDWSEAAMNAAMLDRRLVLLNDRQRYVINKRLEGFSLGEIGRQIGVNQSRAHQIEKEAIGVMK